MLGLFASMGEAATPRPTRTPTPSRTPRGTIVTTPTATLALSPGETRTIPSSPVRTVSPTVSRTIGLSPAPSFTAAPLSPTATATATANPFGVPVAFRTAAEIKNVGGQLTGLAAGNVDVGRGNPFLDLVAPDSVAGAIRWLEGRGTGAFVVRSLSPITEDPFGVALADFDGDNLLDVATIDRSAGSVVVAFGRGDGTFASQTSLVLGGDLRALAAVDHLITLADASTDQVVIVQVDRGRAPSVVDSIAVGSQPQALGVGDFDTNGLADLAVGNFVSGNVTILRQGGGRTFSVFATVAVGPGVSSVAWGDVTGDGAPDLFVARESGEVVVFRNDARRAFTRVFAMRVGREPGAMFVLDDKSPGQIVTGDGRADLVVLHRGANDVGIFAGTGDGRFEASSRLVVGDAPVGLSVGNFDEDPEGAVDLATANAATGTINVIRGQGGGAFVAGLSFATGQDPVAPQIADFDRDGWLDLLVLNRLDGTISLLRGNGRGSLRPRKDFAGVVGATLLASGDFDGDGFVDAALAGEDQSRLTILPNSVTGFGLPRVVPLDAGVSALVGADLDRDGKVDLLASAVSSGRVMVLRSLGASGFEAMPPLDLPGPAVALCVGQIVGDANPDVAVATAEPPRIAVFTGTGGAEFAQVARIDLPAVPAALAVDDFLVDGIPDLAALSPTAKRLDVLAHDGFGGWRIVATEEAPSDSFGLSAADLNGNGVADLVSAQREASTITVWSGDGSGGYLPSTFAVGKGPIDVRVANLNVVSDTTRGLAEVVTVNSVANTVTVLRNVSRATLPPATPTPTVGPGTPPPPQSPTPLPTRTRRSSGSSAGSGGCAVQGIGEQPGSRGLALLSAMVLLLPSGRRLLWRLRHRESARRVR